MVSYANVLKYILYLSYYIYYIRGVYIRGTHACVAFSGSARARGQRAVVVATLRRHGSKERVNALVARMEAAENAYLFAHAGV